MSARDPLPEDEDVRVAGVTIFERVPYGDGFAWRWTGQNAREALTERINVLRSEGPRGLAKARER
jgi:hypothetical protein